MRYLDPAVIDHLHKNYRELSTATSGRTPEFDTVRALFPEGKPLYERAGFWEKTHVQIAVRNSAQIRGVFRIPARELLELGIPNLYPF
jgi:hypothetical protein